MILLVRIMRKNGHYKNLFSTMIPLKNETKIIFQKVCTFYANRVIIFLAAQPGIQGSNLPLVVT